MNCTLILKVKSVENLTSSILPYFFRSLTLFLWAIALSCRSVTADDWLRSRRSGIAADSDSLHGTEPCLHRLNIRQTFFLAKQCEGLLARRWLLPIGRIVPQLYFQFSVSDGTRLYAFFGKGGASMRSTLPEAKSGMLTRARNLVHQNEDRRRALFIETDNAEPKCSLLNAWLPGIGACFSRRAYRQT